MSLDRTRPIVAILSLVIAATSISGCAAGRAGIQIQDAIAARDAALEAGAESSAIYEYTMAHRYRDKAGEEMGTGQDGLSVDLSKKSAEWSDQAIIQIERGARELDLDLRDIDDTVVPPPAVPPDGPIEPDPEPFEEPAVPEPPVEEPASPEPEAPPVSPAPSAPVEPPANPEPATPAPMPPTPMPPTPMPPQPGPTTPEVP